MKYEIINQRFTDTVSEWIGKGYHFNTASMSGHQGEVSKVDLTDGKEIIRIVLTSFRKYSENHHGLEGLEIVVGRCTDEITPDSHDGWLTIWTDHCEKISSERFFQIGERKGWYGTEAEAEAAEELRFKRYVERDKDTESVRLGPKASEIVLNRVRQVKGCKRAKASGIEVWKKVYKSRFTGNIRVAYEAYCNGYEIKIG